LAQRFSPLTLLADGTILVAYRHMGSAMKQLFNTIAITFVVTLALACGQESKPADPQPGKQSAEQPKAEAENPTAGAEQAAPAQAVPEGELSAMARDLPGTEKAAVKGAPSGEAEAQAGTASPTGEAEKAQAEPADGGNPRADSTVASEMLSTMIAMAPQEAVGFAAADVTGMVTEIAALVDLLAGVKLSWGETLKDLDQLFLAKLGISLLALERCGMMVLPKGPIFIVPMKDAPNFPAQADVKELFGYKLVEIDPLWATHIDGLLIVGERSTLKHLLGAKAGEKAKMAAETAALHMAAAMELGQGLLLATGDLRMVTPALQQELPGVELHSLGLVYSRSEGFKLMVKAPDASRKLLLDFMEKTMAEARAALNKAYEQRGDLELVQAAAIVVAYHQWETINKQLLPKEEGGHIVVRLEGLHAAIMPLTGVMSAIAIPAFIKYTRRSKSTEALDSLQRLYYGTMDYAETRMATQGDTAPFAFPPSAISDEKRCCEYPDNRCPSDPAKWDGSPWKELKFSLDEQRYYRYEFKSQGTGSEAKAELSAYGDLDCDGVESTFRRTVSTRPVTDSDSGPKAKNVLVIGGEYFVDQETE